MDLVEHDPRHLPADIGAAVQHGPQDLGGHDHARGVRVDRHVACHEPDVLELVLQVPVLLVAQRLYRRRVYDPLLIPQGHGYGVLGDRGLARGRVRRDEDGLVVLQAVRRLALERVQGVGVLFRGSARRSANLPRGVVGRPRALVDAASARVIVLLVQDLGCLGGAIDGHAGVRHAGSARVALLLDALRRGAVGGSAGPLGSRRRAQVGS
mmetsp:Transcript_75971/g.232528  ORF Transcript_75971/g.232528 Transcript_75971/m.232528 type:complete len:210 (-) Transcript_75971:70-699(-)